MAERLGAVSAAAGSSESGLQRRLPALLGRLHRVRLFHREAQTYMAEALVQTRERRLLPLAARLEGGALVCFSSALWRAREWPDLLGLGIRLFGGRRRVGTGAAPLQDLVLSSAPGVLRAPLGLFSTDTHDFLGNLYHAVGGFEIDGLGPARVRTRWRMPSPAGADRLDRLTAAVVEELARGVLELQPRGSQEWLPLLALELRVPAAVDARELQLSPFNDRGGLHPVGLAQALRFAPRAARQASGRGTTEAAPPRTSTSAR